MDANIETLLGKSIKEAALIGRGWWPIKGGKINRRKRPLKEIRTLFEHECVYATFSLDDEDGEMVQFNWAKSIPLDEDDCDGQSFLVFALKVEDDKIVGVGEFEKDCCDQNSMSFGFGLFELPNDNDDKEMPCEMYSLVVDNFYAQRMIDEVERAIAGRYLGMSHELIGRKLPAYYSDGRESGFSTVRNCYWSLNIDVDDNGLVENVDFSTYISNGSIQANMFSRPELAPNHIEDVVYALLRIIDAYTDEEWETK